MPDVPATIQPASGAIDSYPRAAHADLWMDETNHVRHEWNGFDDTSQWRRLYVSTTTKIEDAIERYNQELRENGERHEAYTLCLSRMSYLVEYINYAHEHGENTVTIKPPSGHEHEVPLAIVEHYAKEFELI